MHAHTLHSHAFRPPCISMGELESEQEGQDNAVAVANRAFTFMYFYSWMSLSLSHRISMTSYLFSLFMITTHALHFTSLWSNHLHHSVTHRSFWHASPHLWNQHPTSLIFLHPNYSSPSQRPSFEHASLTCYTLLSPSTTFWLFYSKLSFQKILSSTLVCRTDLMALDLFLDLFAHRFLCFSSISLCFSYSYVRQTKLASSLVNF